jgi:hypothetical protein
MKRVLLVIALSWCASIGSVISAQTRPVSVPAGTVLHVRTIDPIDVKYAQLGSTFRGSLADPVVSSNGAVLIPRGAPVTLSAVNVKKSSRVNGRDRIGLKVDSITFGGRSHLAATTVSESKGGKKGKRTLIGTGIGAGAGAAIGAISSGAGAAIGALVGGGAGTGVAAATGGKHLRIPPESVLAFQLQSPLRVR